jgi:hypothetical protein
MATRLIVLMDEDAFDDQTILELKAAGCLVLVKKRQDAAVQIMPMEIEPPPIVVKGVDWHPEIWQPE